MEFYQDTAGFPGMNFVTENYNFTASFLRFCSQLFPTSTVQKMT